MVAEQWKKKPTRSSSGGGSPARGSALRAPTATVSGSTTASTATSYGSAPGSPVTPVSGTGSHGSASSMHRQRGTTIDKSLAQREQLNKSMYNKQADRKATILSSNAIRGSPRMEQQVSPPSASQGSGTVGRPLPPPRIQSLPGTNSSGMVRNSSNGDKSNLQPQMYETSQGHGSRSQQGPRGMRSPKLSTKNKESSDSQTSIRGHQTSNSNIESRLQMPSYQNQPSRSTTATVVPSGAQHQVSSGIKSPAKSPRERREGNIAPPLPANPPPGLRQPQDHEGFSSGNSSMSPGLGIPKPTAHVKGHTKVIAPVEIKPTVSLPQSPIAQINQSPIKDYNKANVSPPSIVNSNIDNKDFRKMPTIVSPNLNKSTTNKDYNKVVRQSSSTQTQKSSSADAQYKTNSFGISNGKSKNEEVNSLPYQKQSPSNVALVSPMPKQNPLQTLPKQNPVQTMPKQSPTHTVPKQNPVQTMPKQSPGHTVPKQTAGITSPRCKHISRKNPSSSPTNASILYKDSSLENRRENGIRANILQSEIKRSNGTGNAPLILNIEAMQPTMQPALYGYNQKQSQQQETSSNNIMEKKSSKISYQKGANQIYNQTDSDYSDIENIQIINGYSSDGDMLGSRNTKSAYSGDAEGYLSEGGASLYSQRLNQRIQEGMRHLQSNINRVAQYTQDDSFDDSSSLSSGVSDTLNDLSQDDINFYPDSQTHPKGMTKLHESSMRLPASLGGSPSHKADVAGMMIKTAAIAGDSTQMKKLITSGSRTNVKKAEASQQTDKSAFKQISNTQWKKFVDNSNGGLEQSAREFQLRPDSSLIGGGSQICSQTRYNLVPSQSSSPNSQSINGSSTITPQLIGSRKPEKKREGIYTSREKPVNLVPTQMNGESKNIHNMKIISSSSSKKSTVQSNSTSKPHRILKESEGVNRSGSYQDRESHSLDRLLERPRTKIKVSGGTQTASDSQYKAADVQSDGEYSSNSLGREYQLKTYSLNGPVASQLSQNVKERIMQSSYGKMHVGEYSQYASTPYCRDRSSPKLTDGSLSDSPYATYSEIYSSSPYSSPYSSWVARGSGYASSVSSAPSSRPMGGSLTEGESLESLGSSASNVAAQFMHTRDSRLTQAQLMMHQMSASTSPKLARSNSVRSTKSEKIYAATTSAEKEAYHMSQPTSPTPSGHRLNRIFFSGSSGSTKSEKIYASSGSPHYSPGHGSQASLVSSSSSLYSSHEDKQASDIRKLKIELNDAESKIGTLTNQLTNNQAHVVSAFEKSLTKMTNRLAHVTASSKQKDSEVNDLRKTIEALRQQSIEAGLTVASLQSGRLVRGSSVESVSSLSSACSASSNAGAHHDRGYRSSKKKGWLRSSFTKAFSRGHKKSKQGLAGNESVSDVENYERRESHGILQQQVDGASLPSQPGDCSVSTSPSLHRTHSSGDAPSDCHSLAGSSWGDKDQEVEELRQELQKKDMMLTDIRLDALSSTHQLESLKETINKMRNEMVSLKNDNCRLQRIVVSKSLNSSLSSLPTSADDIERRCSTEDEIDIPDLTNVIKIEPNDKDSINVTISVMIGCHSEFEDYVAPVANNDDSVQECVIGAISVNSKTKWEMLDNTIKQIFKDYMHRIDPVSSLGLNDESITAYRVGEVTRNYEDDSPELLPCGYLVGEIYKIRIFLRGASINHVDILAFETLIPKSIMQRYVSLLSEHRRVILCGPSDTGKTYLANKIAQFIVTRMGAKPTASNINTFNVEHKTDADLRSYLALVSHQCEDSSPDLPLVVILDNLHHAAPELADILTQCLTPNYIRCPYIIGTMSQTQAHSTTDLQLQHNFRWVLMNNHMEPVKGLVGRIARRKLTEAEVDNRTKLPRLQQILDWLPKCWTHINKFLETHSSSEVTIGPCMFVPCPGSIQDSQIWFTDVWNDSLVPYLAEAVREGLQLYGKRTSWEDPTIWIRETYPWPHESNSGPDSLMTLRPEDVACDSLTTDSNDIKDEEPQKENQGESDPLLSMLMRLQEAANYPSPQEELYASIENLENSMESTL